MSKGIVFKNHNNEKIYPCPYYPIGSIFLAVSNVNPASIFGGTWEQIKDRFLLCAGNTYSAGSTGGEANHTLTISEMPNHSHDVRQRRNSPTPYSTFYNSNYQGGQAEFCHTSGSKMINTGSTDNLFTMSVGGSQAHNNMPPYLTVFAWKRVA
jgi:hypothetical protein